MFDPYNYSTIWSKLKRAYNQKLFAPCQTGWGWLKSFDLLIITSFYTVPNSIGLYNQISWLLTKEIHIKSDNMDILYFFGYDHTLVLLGILTSYMGPFIMVVY